MGSDLPTDKPGDATGVVTVTCEDILDLAAAETLHTRLLAAVAAGGDVELHAAAVERIDTANLQLLCATARDLRALGRTLRVTEPSPPLLLAARRLGLTVALGLDM
jgi:anti-anti-sigma regulatory factor